MRRAYDHSRHGIHNLESPAVTADPSGYIAAVSELGPLFYDEVGKAWVCSGYLESTEILSDFQRFSSARIHSPELLKNRGLDNIAEASAMLFEQLLFVDPPMHTELRTVVRDQFATAKVRERDKALRAMADTVLDSLPAYGAIDLVQDFAAPLHAALAGHLLGIADCPDQLTRWADAYGRMIGSLSTMPSIRDRDVIPVLHEAMDTLRAVARTRLSDPGDDLVSSLVQGLGADKDLDPVLDTIAANCVVFAAGGYQTMTHLVSTGVLLLHENPGQQRLLRAKPELIDSAIDEFMRINGSSQYLARQATEDIDFHGVTILAGQPIIVLVAAANLDPRRFTNPTVLDITRQEGRHLGFGMGRHYCIGAPYAERLASWAIRGFLERYPHYQPESTPEWGHHVNMRCLAHAYVRVGQQPPSVLSAADRHRQLVEWNDTDTPLGGLSCLHQVFEKRARLDPNAVAVEAPNTSCTYQELDERANALARMLRARGVQPESAVGLLMERCVDYIVAMLAISKAGGAFLLAEPSCPPERLRAMLAEASATLLLTDGTTVPPDLPVDVLVVDCSGRAATPPITGVTAGNTAYVVFTSGTTGRPKAIAISHEAVVNLHVAQRRVFAVRPSDRVLQFLSPNFDGCVFEVVMAVLGGATLVVAPASQLAVGPPLLRTLRERKVTLTVLTPSVWAALPPDPLPHLRIAAAAGERLPAAVAQRWAAPGRRFLNLYGPAETAVWATWHECDGAREDPPIGRPVANKKLYVLDEQLTPVPAGVQGELCIGGPGIGRYLGHPELMESRFLIDPFGGTSGGLLYRTGDICRWRPDGVLEYVGRRDRQTKIRGQRIELDEVERVLENAPGVVSCSVVERDGRLEAIVVAEPGYWDESVVRAHLVAHLHSGMVPAHLVLVDELPLTINGKLDRDVPIEDVPIEDVPVRPTVCPVSGPEPPVDTFHRESGLTWRISQFFAHCLQLPQRQVRAGSDFFSLGGDSLANAELLTAVEREFGVLLDVEALLHEPTPAGIAGYVLAQEGKSR